GRVLPSNNTGGLAKISTMINEIRAQMPNVLLFDSGDIIHGTHQEYITKGESIISSMNLIKYDAAAVGNHEFDNGLDVFIKTASKAEFPFLSANIKSADGSDWNFIKPYYIKEIDGIRIAVFGLTTLQTLDFQWPDTISDIKLTNPIEEAKSLVPYLKENADVMICLSHLGFEEDKKLAREVDGIDFIIGSHSHTVLISHHFENNTLIAQTGAYAAFLGRIDFIYRKSDTRNEIVSINNQKISWNLLKNIPYKAEYPELALIAVTDNIEPNNDIKDNYLKYKNETDKYLNEEIAVLDLDITADEILLSALKNISNSDAELMSKSSIKTKELKKGNITRAQLYDLIDGYTRQNIVVGDIKLKYLKEIVKSNKYSFSLPDIIDDSSIVRLSTQAFVMMDIMSEYKVDNIELTQYTTRDALVEYFENYKTKQ
ncbi:MAG: metallophosphatase, partial [Armatimonadota bacterium]